MTVLSWPTGRATWAERIGRAGKTIIQSITDTVGYWRRYKNMLHALSIVPESVLGDFGICRRQIPAIAAYAAVAQVDIAVAIDHFAKLPPAPLPASHGRDFFSHRRFCDSGRSTIRSPIGECVTSGN